MDVSGQVDPVVSVVRDIAQARLVARPSDPDAAKAAALTADAEHALLSRHPREAVRLLRQAWSVLA